MTPRSDLIQIARARLRDAELLLDAHRFDGAVYLCGYAIELKLKARICRTLQWLEFPATRGEFHDLTSFRTHDLAVLLLLSGIQDKVLSGYRTEWDEVADWQPEMRYNLPGNVTESKARKMIAAAKTLMRRL